MKRRLAVALIASLLLHALGIFAPRLRLDAWLSETQTPLQATLVMHAPPPKPAPPKPRKHRAKPKPPPALAPVQPVAPTPPAPSEAAPDEAEKPPDEIAQNGPAPAPEPESPNEPPPAAAPEIAPALPRSGRIVYAISRGSGFTVGRAIHEWEHDGKRYRMQATAETTGIAAVFKSVKAVQTSEGGFEQGELKPEDFRFDRGNGDIGTARFDWQARQVTLGDGQAVPLTEGAEDFLSMFYQLAQAAQRGEGFTMAVATGKKVERYAFDWLGEEEVRVPLGMLSTWHVRVQAVEGGKDFTDVWLAKDFAGLPVKIRNTDRKGEVFEQSAVSVDYEGKGP